MVLIEYNILGNLCASFFLCMEASCHKAWTSCGGPTGGGIILETEPFAFDGCVRA